MLELSPPDEPGFVARLRIFNPDGSEAELSGNGAREAILYLRRRGWTEADTFSHPDASPGEIRPTITGADDLPGRHGPRAADVQGLSRRRGRTAAARWRGWRFQHVVDRQPAVRDPRRRPRRRSKRSTCRRSAREIEHARPVPQPHERVVLARAGADAIRARIFERGVGETLSSGTGASGAAVAHVLRGGDSPVTVELDGGELEVDVDESLHVDLTGWAVPIYQGELLSHPKG